MLVGTQAFEVLIEGTMDAPYANLMAAIEQQPPDDRLIESTFGSVRLWVPGFEWTLEPEIAYRISEFARPEILTYLTCDDDVYGLWIVGHEVLPEPLRGTWSATWFERLAQG